MLDRNRTAIAMDLWRTGERIVTRWTLSPDWRDDYQATTVDAWLAALGRRPSGRILNFGDVEDAAYWRRAQELITAAVSGAEGRKECCRRSGA